MKDILGIIVDVDLKTEKGKEYLEITVEPYPYPVSYKGQYHYRSGSTKQELKGAALDKFLLGKQGKRWDGVPQPGLAIEGLSEYPYPETAIREALINAVVHKDYSSGNPIQISVYESKIHFWNEGQLPENWSGKMSGKMSGKILAYIMDNPHITIPKLAALLNVTERTIERNLQVLHKENMIKRIGGAKGGHWEIIEKNEG